MRIRELRALLASRRLDCSGERSVLEARLSQCHNNTDDVKMEISTNIDNEEELPRSGFTFGSKPPQQRLGVQQSTEQYSAVLDFVDQKLPVTHRLGPAACTDVKSRLGRRHCVREDAEDDDVQSIASSTSSHTKKILTEPLIEVRQEYDIEKMEARANKFTDVNSLKRRARRFDEETANELVQVKEAKLRNLRFKRFRHESDAEEGEGDEDEAEHMEDDDLS